MSYLNGLLGEDETVLFTTRQHWFILFSRILFELIVLLVLAAATAVATRVWPPEGRWIIPGAGLLALLVLLSGLRDYLRWRNEQFVVTDRRVLQLKGTLVKDVLDSSLEKINDVELHQSLLGRMFNYGSVEILTASEEGINRMDSIAGPVQFKRAMQDARARYGGYLGRVPQPTYEQPGSDVQSLLEQLAALHARGILSDAEFEAKKRDVLSRI
jgi:membrane protein YdbS with pleckstrin-like domain